MMGQLVELYQKVTNTERTVSEYGNGGRRMLINSILLMAIFIAWMIVNDLFGNRLRTETKVLGHMMITVGIIVQLYAQIRILFF